MKSYQALASIKFLRKSYSLKFLFVAFLGIHIPLIGVVLYVSMSAGSISPLTTFLVTLGLTLLATAITLLVLNQLLKPVILAKEALLKYGKDRQIPELPTDFTDEIGVLMQSVQYTVESLEAVNKTKAELMYTITHDLRSPLTQIVSLVDLVEGEKGQSKWLEMIRMAANQELKFIDNYIKVIESTDNHMMAKMNKLASLKQMVDNVVQMMQSQIELKQLELNVVVDESILVQTTDDYLFERVVRNLVNNAIKFSVVGGTISVYGKTVGNKVMLEVADKGLGFNPDHASQLFEKFTSKGRSGTLGEETNGIGLYLTKEIVEKHQGQIEAFSEGLNKGASFKVVLN